jgi:hypothetical protein
MGSKVSFAPLPRRALPLCQHGADGLREIEKQESGNEIANLHDPVQLDIAQDDDWAHLRNTSLSRGDDQSHHPSTFDGVVMRE